jgi:hypothetical protein
MTILIILGALILALVPACTAGLVIVRATEAFMERRE